MKTALINNFAAIVSALGKNATDRTIGFDMDCEEMTLHDVPMLLANLTMLLCSKVPNCPITFCPYDSQSDWIRALTLINSQLGRQPVVGFNLQTYAGGSTNDPRQWASAVKAAQGTGILNPDNFIWPIVSNSPDAGPIYAPGQVTPLLKSWGSQGASLWELGVSGQAARVTHLDRLRQGHRRGDLAAKRAAEAALSLRSKDRSYWRTISTRRFCGSRTPSAVGTSGWLSPLPTTEIAVAGTPSRTRASLTALARRSDSAML